MKRTLLLRLGVLLILGWFTLSVIFAQLPVGTVRQPVTTDANGSVVAPSNIVFSNQFVMVPAPSLSNHVARFMDVTNASGSSFPVIPVAKGGTGTNTTLLTGAWTNSGNWTVGATNQASFYSVGGIAGTSVVVTNYGVGFTNIMSFGSGILTNLTTIP